MNHAIIPIKKGQRGNSHRVHSSLQGRVDEWCIKCRMVSWKFIQLPVPFSLLLGVVVFAAKVLVRVRNTFRSQIREIVARGV